MDTYEYTSPFSLIEIFLSIKIYDEGVLIFSISLVLTSFSPPHRYVYDENGVNVSIQAVCAIIRDSFNDLGTAGCQVLDRSGDCVPCYIVLHIFLFVFRWDSYMMITFPAKT